MKSVSDSLKFADLTLINKIKSFFVFSPSHLLFVTTYPMCTALRQLLKSVPFLKKVFVMQNKFLKRNK